MIDPNTSESIPPWHKQFWPWFIIALPACAVVASIWTLVIAVKGSDDLVVDEYYKDGMAINRQLVKKDVAQQLGISANLIIAGDQLEVVTSGPVNSDTLSLYLSHPIEADRDFDVILVRATSNRFRARLPQIPGERWHWILETGEGSDWRLDGALSAADFDAGHNH